eukprot:328896-Rhodomonas_salina.1
MLNLKNTEQMSSTHVDSVLLSRRSHVEASHVGHGGAENVHGSHRVSLSGREQFLERTLVTPWREVDGN